MWTSLKPSGNGLKIMFLLFALLLLQPCCLYSDVVLTTEEVTALKTSLTEAKNTLQQQREKIQSLEKNLKDAQISQAELQMIIEAQKAELTRLSESWTELKKDHKKAKRNEFFKDAGVAVVSFLCGFGAGVLK